jgi:hypothetical protein
MRGAAHAPVNPSNKEEFLQPVRLCAPVSGTDLAAVPDTPWFWAGRVLTFVCVDVCRQTDL